MDKRMRGVVAASVAGILAAVGAASMAQAADEKMAGGEKASCYGINKCKGTGACGGKDHTCAGQNACKGKGYIELDKETCLKIEGGRLTPEAS